MGPSVILLAVSIGSGEFVLWPFITSQFGLVVMWAAVVGILTQYFINM
ncbi:MAG: Nramp family divalent metal transporter, partial [Egibacteraceae bacterium]